MKIFNVLLRVQISQIAELPDNPPPDPTPKPFNDNPLKQAEALFERAERIMAPRLPMPGFGMFAPEQDGAQFTQNVRIQAETYEDLQAILKMFADTVKAINKVPDSLLREAVPTLPSMG
jgi:hypothetical protein